MVVAVYQTPLWPASVTGMGVGPQCCVETHNLITGNGEIPQPLVFQGKQLTSNAVKQGRSWAF